MALLVQSAELELGKTLHMMHDTLRSILVAAPPYSVDKETADQIDTAAVVLHQEQDALRQSVAASARELEAQIAVLIASVERLCDLPLEELHGMLRHLTATNTMLGDRMIQLYDEAASLSAVLEQEVMEAPVPSL